MRNYLISLALMLALPACVKKTNPTPQLASGNAFIYPDDSLAEMFQERPVPDWAPKVHSYKPSAERSWDLIHTKLEIKPEWAVQQLKGKAALILEPYFYPQDSLHLDARGFDIYSVKAYRSTGKNERGTEQVLNAAYRYDGLKIHIGFPVAIRRKERILLDIDYLAKPTELPKGGSVAITDDQGMYFINHDGKSRDLPQQIWTQGETQGARCWFPTIDEPNEKCTQEMHITVEERFKTLSNGVMSQSVKKEGGLRTDVWEMKQAHAPYLFMVAIGQYAVVPDKWGNVPLNYWVEPKYRNVAKKIFGRTPAMIEFFSKLLDYPYPWPKYDQVVVRNFVSGAMENTSASVFMESLQSGPRELVDRNWDDIIAHELFHQWFGDLVTLESWANLPLNESFANYSEHLWNEHFLGKDEGDLIGFKEKQQYLSESMRKNEPLIRYNHNKPDDMFDSHSYAKGGRILHMLRYELGDDAFFEGLRLYLKRHAYKNVEIHDLRLALEEVSGRDLNWFFNQWFLRPGHPVLRLESNYDGKDLTIVCEQNQDTSYFPVYQINFPVEIRLPGGKTRREILKINSISDTFRFPMAGEPEMVLFDPDVSVLAEMEVSKPAKDWQNQYYFAGRGIHRAFALQHISDSSVLQTKAGNIWDKVIEDPFWVCREFAMDYLKEQDSSKIAGYIPQLKKIAGNDPKPSTRKKALELLGAQKFSDKKQLLEKAAADSSLAVSSEAYRQYFLENYPDADQKRKNLEIDTSADYSGLLSEYYAGKNDRESFEWFKKKISASGASTGMELIQSLGRFLDEVENKPFRREGFDFLYQLALTETKAEKIFFAYRVLKGMEDIEGGTEKRKAIREKHRNDDIYEYLEYME